MSLKAEPFLSDAGLSMCERLGDRCEGRIFGGPMRCLHGLRKEIMRHEIELEQLRNELDVHPEG
jgi:hypothetical protein